MRLNDRVNMSRHFILILIVVSLCGVRAAEAQMPATISYQGFLTVDGVAVDDPAATLTFRLFNAADGGTAVWYEMHSDVLVEGGVFQVELGAVSSLESVSFDIPLWLSVSLGGLEAPLMNPRIALTAAPYALSARTISDDAIVAGENVTATRNGGSMVISAEVPEIVAGDNVQVVANGKTVVISAIAPDVAPGWNRGGNSGTSPETDFLGTTDEAPLELHVNGMRALRIEPPAIASQGPNIIGGNAHNSVSSGVSGATIAGGGDDLGAIPRLNRVFDSYGTVGGGVANTAGNVNEPGNSGYATVAGGSDNDARGAYSSVGGGIGNKAIGKFATIPGGQGNIAQGEFSFAGGILARADHDGSFVWNGGGTPGGYFASTDASQFLVRADGGIGLGTNDPDEFLHVLSPSGISVAKLGRQGVAGTNGIILEDDDEDGGVQFLWKTAANQFVMQRGAGGGGTTLLLYDRGTNRFNVNAPIAFTTGILGSLYATADGAYSLGFNGRRWLAVYAVNGTINTSDGRLKKDVTALGYGLDHVMQLRPVSYRWTSSEDTSVHLGLIAQEVRDVVPEAVVGNEAEENLGLNYSELIPVLIGAIQDQQRQIEELQEEVARLRTQ